MRKGGNMKKVKLDDYEQDLENNLENLRRVKGEAKLKADLMKAAKGHLMNKKPITIRVHVHDIEAIKLKASKLGVPYQTYLNILIHKDATSE
jgi:predicted DNA binding CopG/RHH family protein